MDLLLFHSDVSLLGALEFLPFHSYAPSLDLLNSLCIHHHESVVLVEMKEEVDTPVLVVVAFPSLPVVLPNGETSLVDVGSVPIYIHFVVVFHNLHLTCFHPSIECLLRFYVYRAYVQYVLQLIIMCTNY